MDRMQLTRQHELNGCLNVVKDFLHDLILLVGICVVPSIPGKQCQQKNLPNTRGLRTVTGNFYPEMEQAVEEISNSMHQIATLE
jgi:hypothetical protein